MRFSFAVVAAFVGCSVGLGSVSRGAMRIIPRKDLYKKCDNKSPSGFLPADKVWCSIGVHVDDSLKTTKSMFDLNQLNFVLGGNKDLVYQIRERQFEVFACPSLNNVAVPADNQMRGGKMKISASAAVDARYWNCKEIYSSEFKLKQICSDYKSQVKARVVLNKVFNEAIGTVTIGQVPFLQTGIPALFLNVSDIIDWKNSIHNYFTASCKSGNFEQILLNALNSKNGITYVSEGAKFAVLETIAIHATRTDAGRKVDESESCGNTASYRSSYPTDLSYGDRSRTVVMNPRSVHGGALDYEAFAMDDSLNPMSLGQSGAPSACSGMKLQGN